MENQLHLQFRSFWAHVDLDAWKDQLDKTPDSGIDDLSIIFASVSVRGESVAVMDRFGNTVTNLPGRDVSVLLTMARLAELRGNCFLVPVVYQGFSFGLSRPIEFTPMVTGTLRAFNSHHHRLQHQTSLVISTRPTI